MIKKTLFYLLFFTVLGKPAHAALVSDTSFIDNKTGLEWLKLSETANMTVTEALAAFPGWQIASFTQVSSLLNSVMPDYASEVVVNCDYNSDCAATGTEWIELFGSVKHFSPTDPTLLVGHYAFGVYNYFDQDKQTNSLRLVGARQSLQGAMGLRILGTGLTSNYDSLMNQTNSSAPYLATYLVKAPGVAQSQSVSAPVSAWLLIAAMALIALRRR